MRLSKLPAICLILLLACCRQQSGQQRAEQTTLPDNSGTAATPASGQPVTDSIPVPAGMTQLAVADGDLDKDGIAERVVVYDTKKDTDFGTERQLHIFRRSANGWTLWHRSIGAVLPSEHGGVNGDPFQDMTIQAGCIVIEHFGGSMEKWAYTHRFRYQNNNWYLIGATIHFGTPCKEWKDYDYNLSTGRIEVTEETESCDDNGDNAQTSKNEQYSFTRKLPALPLMDGFYPGDNKVNIPGRDASFYY